ncbi:MULTISPECIES: hypothetical protein [Halomicrobium]|nr:MULTISPECIES: hypothetical protein [Halomicrobium]
MSERRDANAPASGVGCSPGGPASERGERAGNRQTTGLEVGE